VLYQAELHPGIRTCFIECPSGLMGYKTYYNG